MLKSVTDCEPITQPLIFHLKQRPTWRREPGAITFLKTNRTDLYAAKQWIAGKKEAIDYARVTHWVPFVALATNIEQLSEILTRAAGEPRITAVRGAVRVGSLEKPVVNRRIHDAPGKEAPDMEDAPRCWLMIDLDSQPEPSDFDWRLDPRRAAKWAAERYLPEPFRGRPFHYQYSGSAGIKPGLRLHFWFWLTEPRSSAELRRYFRRVNSRCKLFDEAIYNAVQPHYTAAPVFLRIEDPLAGNRGGLIQ